MWIVVVAAAVMMMVLVVVTGTLVTFVAGAPQRFPPGQFGDTFHVCILGLAVLWLLFRALLCQVSHGCCGCCIIV